MLIRIKRKNVEGRKKKTIIQLVLIRTAAVLQCKSQGNKNLLLGFNICECSPEATRASKIFSAFSRTLVTVDGEKKKTKRDGTVS